MRAGLQHEEEPGASRDAAPVRQSPRTVAVLGGAGGIGRAVVARLLAKGDQVVVLDTAAALERYPAPVPSVLIDIESENGVRSALGQVGERFDSLDGMVCISGILGKKQRVEAIELDEFDRIIRVNLRGLLLVSKIFMPLLERGGASSLVLMSSAIVGRVLPTYGAYTISKAGLIALTKQLALEHAPRVRVNAVAPGAVDTAFSRGGTGSDEANPQTDYDSLLHLIPMRRVATPDDIAGPIGFLLGDESRYMTGQVLWITGGMYMP